MWRRWRRWRSRRGVILCFGPFRCIPIWTPPESLYPPSNSPSFWSLTFAGITMSLFYGSFSKRHWRFRSFLLCFSSLSFLSGPFFLSQLSSLRISILKASSFSFTFSMFSLHGPLSSSSCFVYFIPLRNQPLFTFGPIAITFFFFFFAFMSSAVPFVFFPKILTWQVHKCWGMRSEVFVVI